MNNFSFVTKILLRDRKAFSADRTFGQAVVVRDRSNGSNVTAISALAIQRGLS